ncbi:MAG TPA: hypothetical protein VJJ53_02030 [Candidatus Nanoarchaeia archaeon]|nr:hypothetical protein [Candidatus Nanoarchaeia archaeon]
MELPKKYLNLRKGAKLKINGKVYTVKRREFHKAEHEHASDNISYELGNNHVLEYEWDWSFFRIETKTSFLGFETTKHKIIKIEDIKTV